MKNVAIIGSGISGMGAAYYLKDHFDITIFEKNSRPGGHTNTIQVQEEDRVVPVDTGFIVFNHRTYPNLVRLFQELHIEEHAASMGFSVWNRQNGIQYCGSGLGGLFAQQRNLVRPWYYNFLLEVHRFNQQAPHDLREGALPYADCTLGEYLAATHFSESFRDNYILPMGSAIWSTPAEQMLDFPASTMIRFFENHGLLGLKSHHQWYSVRGGSQTYLDRIHSLLKNKIRCNEAVLSVRREPPTSTGDLPRVEVRTNQGLYNFDAVILAGHAPDMLAILKDPLQLEERILSKFPYHANRAVLHTDTGMMPPLRTIWSAWNYKIGQEGASTVYYMNRLQSLSTDVDYFVSINEIDRIDEKKIICEIDYEHPLFTSESIRAQKHFHELNEAGPVYFAGAYSRYGFHEDGLQSARSVSERLMAHPLMTVDAIAGRKA